MDMEAWIREHAQVIPLCEADGWPDIEHARIDICSKSKHEWIIQLSFNESIMEISECAIAEYNRCGAFSIHFDHHGKPCEIQLLYPM